MTNFAHALNPAAANRRTLLKDRIEGYAEDTAGEADIQKLEFSHPGFSMLYFSLLRKSCWPGYKMCTNTQIQIHKGEKYQHYQPILKRQDLCPAAMNVKPKHTKCPVCFGTGCFF